MPDGPPSTDIPVTQSDTRPNDGMPSDGDAPARGDARRRLPSVDRLLASTALHEAAQHYGHALIVEVARETLATARAAIRAGAAVPTMTALARDAAQQLDRLARGTLYPVINATGVIIHTNLGRAPLSSAARQAMEAVAAGYSNLEYDLDAGERGSRHVHAESLLCRLTGAEAAGWLSTTMPGLFYWPSRPWLADARWSSHAVSWWRSAAGFAFPM